MTEVGESSSASASSAIDKPVIVRVKRKSFQSPVEAFWLEINERPSKRPLIDIEKLSISGSSTKEELKTRRVFVHHVDTVSSSEDTINVLQSFVVQCGSDGATNFKARSREQRHSFKKENKQDQLISKARQEQETLAKNARFEQIWRSRRGIKEEVHESMDGVCRLYDVLRVDEEKMPGWKREEEMSVEDQAALSNYLPLLRDVIPVAAEEIEFDIRSYVSGQSLCETKDEYVYDLYAVTEDVAEADEHPFPLVQVADDDFYDGPDYSDYETDDSNAENHPFNDYPDEMTSEEDEESTTSGSESEESDSDSEDESDDSDRLMKLKRMVETDDDEDDDYDDFGSYLTDEDDDDDRELN